MKKAMILGVSGMVGEALAMRLLAQGWAISGAARFSNPDTEHRLRAAGMETYRFDVTRDDPSALPDAEVVFLEIWDPSRPDLIWPINFYGVGRVVERYAGSADFVNGSTINVYGNAPEPSSEETPCRPDSDYGRSRYAQERLIDYFCHRSGSRCIHVRYAHANSPSRGLLRRFAETILAEKSLGNNPDALVQVIGLEDFVRVTAAAVTKLANPPALVNCCHPKIWTQRALADELTANLGRGRVVFDAREGGRENSACATADRMVEWFGAPEVDVQEVIRRTAEAARAED